MMWEEQLEQKFTKKEALKLKKKLKKFKSHGTDEWFNAIGLALTGKNYKSVSTALRELYKKRDILETASFQDARDDICVEIGFIENPPNISYSNEPCPRCKQMKVTYYQRQTRSSDEPITTFFFCTDPKCKKSWKVY